MSEGCEEQKQRNFELFKPTDYCTTTDLKSKIIRSVTTCTVFGAVFLLGVFSHWVTGGLVLMKNKIIFPV